VIYYNHKRTKEVIKMSNEKIETLYQPMENGVYIPWVGYIHYENIPLVIEILEKVNQENFEKNIEKVLKNT